MFSGTIAQSKQGGATPLLAKISRPNGDLCNNAADAEAEAEAEANVEANCAPLVSSLQDAGSRVCEAITLNFMCNFSIKITFGHSAKLMGPPCSACPRWNNCALDRMLEVIIRRIQCKLSSSLSNALPSVLALDNFPSFGVTNIVASEHPSHQPLEVTATTLVPFCRDFLMAAPNKGAEDYMVESECMSDAVMRTRSSFGSLGGLKPRSSFGSLGGLKPTKNFFSEIKLPQG